MIFQTVDEFINSSAWTYIKDDIKVMTSGGMECIHIGHTRCIRESAQIANRYHGRLIVIVNSDEFLIRKKGESFMCHAERLEIVDAIKGVDYAVGWDDGSQTVIGALEKIRPNYFTKGGDRSTPESVPEYDICQQIGCQILFGVGGAEKIQSSTNLIGKIKK